MSFLVLVSSNCNQSQEGTLSVEAGLVFKAGDVKPVARTQFYLLDDSLETILKNAKVEPFVEQLSVLQNYAVGQYAKKNFSATTPENTKAIILKTENAIKPHIVSTMTTDFNGKGVFPTVKSGKYYLMGVGEAGKQTVIWDMPVNIQSSSQSVILDNNNSADVFSSHL